MNQLTNQARMIPSAQRDGIDENVARIYFEGTATFARFGNAAEGPWYSERACRSRPFIRSDVVGGTYPRLAVMSMCSVLDQ